MNPHMLCDELQCDVTLRNECTSMVSFCACHPSCSGHEYHVDSYEHCCKCFVSFDFPFEPPLYLPFDSTRSISIGTGPSVELPAVSDPKTICSDHLVVDVSYIKIISLTFAYVVPSFYL